VSKNKIFSTLIDTPIPGYRLGVRVRNERLVSVEFVSSGAQLIPPDSRFSRHVVRQFERYFEKQTWPFDVDLFAQGTEFQRRVWLALTNIPPGEVRRYGELALTLNSSARAVGNACRVNPLPIIVPCHRVVAATGIGGFMGQRRGGELDIKRWLLAHEGITQ